MTQEIAILGAGMHPWGKWGKNFVEYGVAAAREALADSGVPWQEVRFVSGAATIRCGYPGQVAGATIAQALGWQGAEVNTSYAACASGSQALAAARSKILSGACDVALVVGADTTPKGFLAPAKGYRPEDPDWVRFYLGVTNPTYFGLYAHGFMTLWTFVDVYQSAMMAHMDRSGSLIALLPGVQGFGQFLGPNVSASVLGAGLGYNVMFVVSGSMALVALALYIGIFVYMHKRRPAVAEAEAELT